MSRPSILDDVPDIVQETIRRALRNVTRLSDELTRVEDELDASMAPDQELLAEFRRMCARKGIDASEPSLLKRADVSTTALVPAYMLSELKTAFVMGFKVYLPFLAKVRYQGVTGTIAFEPNGDLANAPITLYTFRNGRKTKMEVIR